MLRSNRTDVLTYLRDVFNGWLGLASGSAGVLLALVAWFVDSAAVNKQITIVVAALCAVFATYNVWRQERRARIDVEGTYRTPKFRGIFEIREYVNAMPSSSIIRLIVQFQNVSAVDCGVTRLAMTATNNKATKTVSCSTEDIGMRRHGGAYFTFAQVMSLLSKLAGNRAVASQR